MRTGRRQVLVGAAAACMTGCFRAAQTPEPVPPAPSAARPATPVTPAGNVELWSWFDLPVEPRSRELSGIAWDGARKVLWAVQDHRPAIVELVPDHELRTWSLGEEVQLDDVPRASELDLEGLVVLPDRFFLSSEVGPRLFEVDRHGKYMREVDFPPVFKEARHNKSFESLTSSPSGRTVFTTTEVALPRDGPIPTVDAGTRVRILRLAIEAGGVGGIVGEYAYETDALPVAKSSLGVSDMCALSETDLLVLERSWAPELGNRVRIYRVSLAGLPTLPRYDALPTDLRPLAKQLVVDIGTLNATPPPPKKQPQQPNPLLENYEGIALGPSLPDGRRAVILVSDDNGQDVQTSRLLVLALPEQAPQDLASLLRREAL